MLRRFSRPGFRRRGFVKRRKFSGRGRYKRSNYKKKLVGGAARAARSSYTNTPMCRDLGSIWPSCLITKLRFRAIVPLDYRTATVSMTENANDSTSYSAFFTFWPNYGTGGTPNPCGPLVAVPYGATSSTAAPSATGFTAATAEAMGIDKLLSEGKSGSATGPYSRCCVLSAKFKHTVTAAHASITVGDAKVPFTCPGEHYLHPMCSKDQIITAITSQATSDGFWNQPDVRRKYSTGRAHGYALNNSGGAETVAVAPPAASVVWRI